jgi:predicted phage-related endonuclease
MGHLIYKPTHGSLEWLRLRHRTEDGHPVIAASEAAAVHGEHRFKTRHELFAEKVAADPVVTDTNEAMDRGNRLEPTIRQWAADKLDTRLVEPSFMYMVDSSQYAMVATLDAVDEYSYEESAVQPRLVVEIKTYSRQWDGVLPRYWYWQGVQQAICAGVDEIVWGIFDATLDLHVHRQTVEEWEKILHIEETTDFLWFVKMGEIPNDWPAAYDEVQKAYPSSSANAVDLSSVREMMARLRMVMADRKLLEKEEDELKAAVGLALGGNDTGTLDGDTVVTWKQQSRTSFDSKKFSADHPDLYEKYQMSSTFRVMRLKGEK